MKSKFFRVLAVASLMMSLPLFSLAAEPQKLYRFELVTHNLKQWQSFIGDRDTASFDDFAAPGATRHMLELFWFKEAARLGGCNCQIEYTGSDIHTHARSLAEVTQGRALAHPVAIFDQDLRIDADKVALSDPVMQSDWFFVGFYTHSLRHDVLGIDTQAELQKLRVGVAESWQVDRKVVADLGYQPVLAGNWHALLRMVMHGRIDVLLQPFSGDEDFGFDDTQPLQRFVPVPNWKLPFEVGRRYFVSKSHPDSEAFLAALNAGLRQVTANGRLRQSYEQAGVINARVADWQVFSNAAVATAD